MIRSKIGAPAEAGPQLARSARLDRGLHRGTKVIAL